METTARLDTPPLFLTPWLFVTDSRLVLTLLNHLRHQALHRVFGTSREQANALTAVLLLATASSAYESARRITGMRLSASDAGLGAVALREAALGLAGPNARVVPGFGPLVGFAVLGGLVGPGIWRAAQRVRAAERWVRRERIRRYAEAQGPEARLR